MYSAPCLIICVSNLDISTFQLNLCKSLRMLCHGLATTPSSGELTEVDIQALITSMKEIQAVKDLTWSSETLETKKAEEVDTAPAPVTSSGICHTDVNLFSRLSTLRAKEEAAPLADLPVSLTNGGPASLKAMSATFPFADDVAEAAVNTYSLSAGTAPFASAWKGEFA